MLEETSVVDMIVNLPEGKLALIITDSGTSDEATRSHCFREKIAHYAAYVASDQFSQEYPDIDLSTVVVRVMSPVPPTDVMQGINEIALADGNTRIPVEFIKFP